MSSSGDHYEDWPEQLYQPLNTPVEFPVTTSPTTSKSSVSKPIRRRSRSSKKTPATIHNANPNNFKSLVHQLTGRPKLSPATFPLAGSHRGPVNLDFRNYREQDYNNVAVAGAPQYSDSEDRNYIGLAASDKSSFTFPDQGLAGVTGMSSFNNGYSQSPPVSKFDGGFVESSRGSLVAVAAPQEEFDDHSPVEELPDLARVSEGLSYSACREEYW